MKLKTVKHNMPGSCWCGPAVVSSVTGLSTASITRQIQDWRMKNKGLNNRPAVAGTHSHELSAVLAGNGYSVNLRRDTYAHAKYPTLARWLKNTYKMRDSKTVYMLLIGGTHPRSQRHWVAIKGNYFCDNKTREPILAKKADGRRRQVIEVLEIKHKNTGGSGAKFAYIDVDGQPYVSWEYRNSNGKWYTQLRAVDYEQLRRFSRKHGIEINDLRLDSMAAQVN